MTYLMNAGRTLGFAGLLIISLNGNCFAAKGGKPYSALVETQTNHEVARELALLGAAGVASGDELVDYYLDYKSNESLESVSYTSFLRDEWEQQRNRGRRHLKISGWLFAGSAAMVGLTFGFAAISGRRLEQRIEDDEDCGLDCVLNDEMLGWGIAMNTTMGLAIAAGAVSLGFLVAGGVRTTRNSNRLERLDQVQAFRALPTRRKKVELTGISPLVATDRKLSGLVLRFSF